jgi:hypothetical protein
MGASIRTWPSLLVDEWMATRDTLHMWTQIVGKIRMGHMPLINHWWQVTLYVSARGLTTGRSPTGTRYSTSSSISPTVSWQSGTATAAGDRFPWRPSRSQSSTEKPSRRWIAWVSKHTSSPTRTRWIPRSRSPRTMSTSHTILMLRACSGSSLCRRTG